MPNKKKQGTAFVLGFCLLLLSLAACKTPRQLTSEEVVEIKKADEFFLSVQKQAFQYRTFSARIRAELNFPNKEFSSRVDIKMVKDSALQLSVQPFAGMELFRIEFNTDSLKIIDRLNKRYATESYAGLKGSMPIDFNFYNLQALFTNQIFVPGEREISPRQYRRFRLRQEGAATEASIQDALKLLYSFQADRQEKLLATRITDAAERYTLQWLYTDFSRAGEQDFPMKMDAKIWNEGKQEGGIKLLFSRIQQDIPLNMDFSIPEKYKRISFEEIIKGVRPPTTK
jgi:hypothetical protein